VTATEPTSIVWRMTLTHSTRTIIVSDSRFALAEPLETDLEAVDAQCDAQFDLDADHRPVPWEITTYRASVLDAVTGELIGDICWRPVPYLPSLSGTTWNIGIALVPSGRNRGGGAAAGMLLIRHLFATTEIDRVQMIVEAANVPGWRALERIGMYREGVLRQVGVRGGKRRDLLLYSMVRSDLEPSDGKRRILARLDGLALAQTWPTDRDAVPDPLSVGPDDQISPAVPQKTHRATLLADGTLIGTATWHAVDYGPTLADTAWSLHLNLLPKTGRHATGAYRLLAGYLFDSTGVNRLEVRIDPDDPAARSATTKAGFCYEGTIRGARGGQDLTLYGRLRGDLDT
jgi:RimJ/RimL family protein N-acetyltransferase